MPIEVKCDSCGSRLQVNDEHAGKKTRCPKCDAVTTIPALGQTTKSPPQSPTQSPQIQPQAPKPKRSPAAAQADAMSNPYSSPMPASAQHQGSRGFPEIWPLHGAVTYIKATAWALFIFGGIYCLTIVGIVIAWLPIWMGLCLQRAATGIEDGCQTGNPQSIAAATTNLSTFFKIIGVLSIINLVMFALYVGIVILALIGGAIGAANA